MSPDWTLMRDVQLNSDYARLFADRDDDKKLADTACTLVDAGDGEAYEICSAGYV